MTRRQNTPASGVAEATLGRLDSSPGLLEMENAAKGWFLTLPAEKVLAAARWETL